MRNLIFIFVFVFAASLLSAQGGHIENATAGENITAPAWVYISSTNGKAYKAIAATDWAPAVGIVFADAVADGSTQILFSGVYEWAGASFTEGATYYLSATTAGAMTVTPPTNKQPLGRAVSETRIAIEPTRFTGNGIYGGSDTIATGAVARVAAGSTFALGYANAAEGVLISDAASKAVLKSKNGNNSVQADNFGVGVTASGSVGVTAGINISNIATHNVILNAGGETQQTSVGTHTVTADKLYITADSVNITGIPSNFTGERTFITVSPGGTLTKQEGITAEDLTFTPGDILNGGSTTGATVVLGTNDAQAFRVETSNTERISVTSGGDVGIGTTSPSQKLHVDGSARVTGAYYDSNNSPGTSGEVMSSTATGTDWVAALPYKIYVANITQSGTSAPSATILENTLGVTPTWGRTGLGIYTLTATGAWVTNKTALPDSRVFIGGEDSDEVAASIWVRTSADVLTMRIVKPSQALENNVEML